MLWEVWPPVNDKFAEAVEGAIADGANRGEFEGLLGHGKPLQIGDISDPDWWVRQKIKRENLDMSGAMAPSLVLRREAATYPEALVTEHREAEVRRTVEDYNQRVLDDRRRPVVGPPPPVAPILDVEEIVAGWRLRRAEYEALLKERIAAAQEATPDDPPDPPWWRRWWRRR